MVAASKLPVVMSADEFLAWDAPGTNLWQLVDGEPQAMAPASHTHGAIQSEIVRLIGNHLAAREPRCSVVVAPGVIPRIRADMDVRVPDLAVTCSPYETEESALADPVPIVEILSPSNQAETWSSVWTYTTIPSVREILVLHSAVIAAELLLRAPDGAWPPSPARIDADGTLALESVGFAVPLLGVYRTTHLHPAARAR